MQNAEYKGTTAIAVGTVANHIAHDTEPIMQLLDLSPRDAPAIDRIIFPKLSIHSHLDWSRSMVGIPWPRPSLLAARFILYRLSALKILLSAD